MLTLLQLGAYSREIKLLRNLFENNTCLPCTEVEFKLAVFTIPA